MFDDSIFLREIKLLQSLNEILRFMDANYSMFYDWKEEITYFYKSKKD